jgi:secondary thiamine-phosphate synthase enzyme
MQTIDIKTTTREEMIDVTALVRSAIKQTGVSDGIACVYCPHTTAAVTMQENTDPDVKADLVGHMSRVVPRSGPFRHDEGNSDAHIKSSLVGPSLTVIVSGGRPILGSWQAIFFCEFDGPRDRKVLVKVVRG